MYIYSALGALTPHTHFSAGCASVRFVYSSLHGMPCNWKQDVHLCNVAAVSLGYCAVFPWEA
jgi:hypothetical protein